ncbi:TPA: hypothetical protein ACH3X1_013906 [Trebouxia sp. C0004]
MKIKKRSGDKEHCLRLLPCLGRGSRHPHQDEQLVNDLVHSFWKMLEQRIWDAIWTSCFPIFSGPTVGLVFSVWALWAVEGGQDLA